MDSILIELEPIVEAMQNKWTVMLANEEQLRDYWLGNMKDLEAEAQVMSTVSELGDGGVGG